MKISGVIPWTEMIAAVVVAAADAAVAAEVSFASFAVVASSSAYCCCCCCYWPGWLVASFASDVIAAPEFVHVAAGAIVLGRQQHCSSRKKY